MPGWFFVFWHAITQIYAVLEQTCYYKNISSITTHRKTGPVGWDTKNIHPKISKVTTQFYICVTTTTTALNCTWKKNAHFIQIFFKALKFIALMYKLVCTIKDGLKLVSSPHSKWIIVMIFFLLVNKLLSVDTGHLLLIF